MLTVATPDLNDFRNSESSPFPPLVIDFILAIRVWVGEDTAIFCALRTGAIVDTGAVDFEGNHLQAGGDDTSGGAMFFEASAGLFGIIFGINAIRSPFGVIYVHRSVPGVCCWYDVSASSVGRCVYGMSSGIGCEYGVWLA